MPAERRDAVPRTKRRAPSERKTTENEKKKQRDEGKKRPIYRDAMDKRQLQSFIGVIVVISLRRTFCCACCVVDDAFIPFCPSETPPFRQPKPSAMSSALGPAGRQEGKRGRRHACIGVEIQEPASKQASETVNLLYDQREPGRPKRKIAWLAACLLAGRPAS